MSDVQDARTRILQWLGALGKNSGSFTADEVAMSCQLPHESTHKALDSLTRRQVLVRSKGVEAEPDGSHITNYRLR